MPTDVNTAQKILHRHGIAYVATSKKNYTTNCPDCGGKGYLNVTINNDGVAWFCHHCQHGDGERYEQQRKKRNSTGDANSRGEPTAIYDYVDENGARLFQVVRFEPVGQPKKFRQRTGPEQKNWSVKGVRLVPFCLPELLEAIANDRVVFVAEGEKDVLTLRAHGVVATTNAMGAGKWRDNYNIHFRGADVVICGDNDQQGRDHVREVADHLHGVARRVRVLDLAAHWSEIEHSDDISDWFERGGGTAERLWKIVEGLTDYAPHAVVLGATDDTDSDKSNTSETNGGPSKQRDRGRNTTRLLPSPSEPMQVAREFVSAYCTHDGELIMRHWRGGWWCWRQSHWIEAEERAVRTMLYHFTEPAVYLVDKNFAPWAPNRRKITDVADALTAICFLSNEFDQPSWLDGESKGTVVAFANGLLALEQRKLLAHTPRFFNQTSVPFDYDATAPQPERWLKFLAQLWPWSEHSAPRAEIDLLGEWMGYIISGRLDLHKIMIAVGPTRGGKGVIARILGHLIGRQNVAGPTLNSLGGDFGLAPLIGRPLAVISDARFAGRNGHIVVERLLSISGEDTLTVNRKYRDQWTGKLPSRLHVISNELPALGDASTAIIGRLLLLPFTHSWLGKEDHGLETALQTELSGILNWALAGLERLTVSNGNRFTRVPHADEAITQMRDLASPVAAFVRTECELGPDKQVPIDELYRAFQTWAEINGHAKKNKHVFGRDLRAAVPRVKVGQVGPAGHRNRVYVGIARSPREGAEE